MVTIIQGKLIDLKNQLKTKIYNKCVFHICSNEKVSIKEAFLFFHFLYIFFVDISFSVILS